MREEKPEHLALEGPVAERLLGKMVKVKHIGGPQGRVRR
jgi:hypothetical protein